MNNNKLIDLKKEEMEELKAEIREYYGENVDVNYFIQDILSEEFPSKNPERANRKYLRQKAYIGKGNSFNKDYSPEFSPQVAVRALKNAANRKVRRENNDNENKAFCKSKGCSYKKGGRNNIILCEKLATHKLDKSKFDTPREWYQTICK